MGLGLTPYIPYAIYLLWWLVIGIALFKTEIGLLFLIPLLPFQNLIDKLQQFPLGKDLVDLLLLAIFIGWTIRVNTKKDKLIQTTSFNWPLMILIVLTYIGLWRGSEYLGADLPISTSDPRLAFWKNYIIIFIIYYFVVNNIKDRKWIFSLIILMGISILFFNRWFYSTYQWSRQAHFSYEQRLSLSYLSPNMIAAFFGRYLFIFLGISYFDKSKIRKLIYFVIICFSLYSVVFSFARSVYLGVVIGFIIFALIKDKKLLIPIIILLIFWNAILPVSVVERITMTVTEEGQLESSALGRVDVWENSMELFKSNPLFGVGFQVIPFMGWSLEDSHNQYVSFLTELGIIGLSLFLFLFYLALQQCWRLYRRAKDDFFRGLGLGGFIAVIVCMITNFFGDHWSYIQLGAFYWAFLGVIVRANIITQEEKAAKIIAGELENNENHTFNQQ